MTGRPDLEAAVEQALKQRPIDARRLGREDARQTAWLAALEADAAGRCPVDAADRALHRARTGRSSKVASIDELNDRHLDGRTDVGRWADEACSPWAPGVFTVSMSDIDGVPVPPRHIEFLRALVTGEHPGWSANQIRRLRFPDIREREMLDLIALAGVSTTGRPLKGRRLAATTGVGGMFVRHGAAEERQGGRLWTLRGAADVIGCPMHLFRRWQRNGNAELSVTETERLIIDDRALLGLAVLWQFSQTRRHGAGYRGRTLPSTPWAELVDMANDPAAEGLWLQRCDGAVRTHRFPDDRDGAQVCVDLITLRRRLSDAAVARELRPIEVAA